MGRNIGGLVSTSLTDTVEYRDFCRRAATDPATFQTFRRQPEYEHVVRVGEDDGGRYLRRLTDVPVDAASTIGDPRMYDYPGASVPLDPVMVRYYHDRQEIRRWFGSTTEMDVLEIGGGFGGLARLLAPETSIYDIRDLSEARMLQDAYLERFGLTVGDAVAGHPYDLVVSTFAFSELTRETMSNYEAHYLRHCLRGWMICNFLAVEQVYEDEMLELVQRWHPLARWEPETPETHPANRVMVWGDL
jgi:hypothetical protein